MPHLIVEYTDNLTNFPELQVLTALNTAVIASGQVHAETDLKSRIVRTTQFAIGTDSTSVIQILQNLQTLLDDRMAFIAFDVCHKTDTTGIVLVGGII